MTVIEPEILTTPETTEDDGDHDRFSHIVPRGLDGTPAAALITKAQVTGFPVMALCGKKWIPSRDPYKYEVCPTCQKILAEKLGRA